MIIAPVRNTISAMPGAAATPIGPASSVPVAAPAGRPTAPGMRFETVFDFPTLLPGDQFRIARGSTANGIGIGGEARLNELTPNIADLWIRAGTFGFYREATIRVEQDSETTVKITVTEPGKEPAQVAANIVAVKPNYSEFASGDPAQPGAATLQLDATGRLIVDIAGGGQLLGGASLHLILEKRSSPTPPTPPTPPPAP